MPHTIFASHDPLHAKIVRRESSYFAKDLADNLRNLTDEIKGSKCLFIGAGGSIGSNTLKTVLAFEPAAIYVIDHNENGLAELVRDLRSQSDIKMPPEFVTLPFDYGGPIFQKWFLSQSRSFDFILNFAALKHVRSEKDPYSVLAMLETNVMKLARLQSLLNDDPKTRRLFSVSTDKAANPSSMMGATKRLMEHALFLPSTNQAGSFITSSARFANVALSNGSLLQSWEYRLKAQQPFACPKDCRRYFVSLPESGHLCTLAAFFATRNQIFLPDMAPEDHLILLEEVVQDFLAIHGLEATFLDTEAEAKARLPELVARNKYPVLLTPLNTSGEKPYEEFVAEREVLKTVGMTHLKAVDYLPPQKPETFWLLLEALQSRLFFQADDVAPTDTLDINALRQLIATVEPAFLQTHRQSRERLDERM